MEKPIFMKSCSRRPFPARRPNRLRRQPKKLKRKREKNSEPHPTFSRPPFGTDDPGPRGGGPNHDAGGPRPHVPFDGGPGSADPDAPHWAPGKSRRPGLEGPSMAQRTLLME